MTPFQKHVHDWKDCTRCPLHSQRNRIVLARGKIPCDVLFIGEAPGESENVTGSPFDGPAGKELDGWIARSMPTEHVGADILVPALRVGFTNIVACFPAEAKEAKKNEPTKAEIAACKPRLDEFINLCRPRLIVCVGKLSTDWIDHNAGIRCVDIVHPAAVLRANVAQQSMMVRRAIVQLTQALEQLA